MKRLLHLIATAAHYAAIPITRPIDWLFPTHPEYSKRVVHMIIGTLLMMLGEYLAHHVPQWANHILWGGTSYGIHAFGAAPIIKVLADWLKYEI